MIPHEHIPVHGHPICGMPVEVEALLVFGMIFGVLFWIWYDTTYNW